MGGILIQCANAGAISPDVDVSLALLANLLGAGYLAAASTLGTPTDAK
jgi:hypothetical protein